MPAVLRATLFVSLCFALCGYALGRGGRPERQLVSIFATGLVATWIVTSPVGHRFAGPEIGVALVDASMLAAMIRLMLVADRFWPTWVAAMQIVIVLGHVGEILKPFTWPGFYRNMIQLWAYPQLAVLAVGTLRHRLRTGPSRLERSLGRGAAWLRPSWAGAAGGGL